MNGLAPAVMRSSLRSKLGSLTWAEFLIELGLNFEVFLPEPDGLALLPVLLEDSKLM